MRNTGDEIGLQAAKKLVEDARSIVVLTGAGVSAESGVPTFRSGGKSLVWRGMPFEQLSSAEMVERDLPLVWEWFDYRRGILAQCMPNAAHTALAEAQESGRFDSLTLITQNVDGLHRNAGSTEIIELHGNIQQARCLSCRVVRTLDQLPEDERPPICPECSDPMRPNVVLFGEALEQDSIVKAYESAAASDLCLVIGTSAVVYPANQIPIIAKRNGAAIIEINPEETPLTYMADVSIKEAAGDVVPKIFEWP
ncbi:MAG TPA: NAD-dependent deacylase [Pyrinomonadaceae bacterium]|nr:NAD-dependent deacylase [Pyrinomonadaceae bacterium]